MLSWNSAASQRRVEVPHPLLEQVRLHRRGQRRAHRALVGLERAEERREHLVAIGARARLPVQRERGRVQAHRLARRQLDGRVREVGVGEHAVHLAAGPLHLARLGGHLLLGRRPACAACGAASLPGTRDRAPSFGSCADPLPHLGGVQRQDLRTHPGGRRRERRGQLLRRLLHLARARRPDVLVGQAAGVDRQPRQLEIDVEHRLQRGQQLLGRLAQAAPVLRQLRHALARARPWPWSTPPPTDRGRPRFHLYLSGTSLRSAASTDAAVMPMIPKQTRASRARPMRRGNVTAEDRAVNPGGGRLPLEALKTAIYPP